MAAIQDNKHLIERLDNLGRAVSLGPNEHRKALDFKKLKNDQGVNFGILSFAFQSHAIIVKQLAQHRHQLERHLFNQGMLHNSKKQQKLGIGLGQSHEPDRLSDCSASFASEHQPGDSQDDSEKFAAAYNPQRYSKPYQRSKPMERKAQKS